MVRRRTFEALLRAHERERAQLIQVIREQNDRLMHLAGRTWTPSPAETSAALQDEPPELEPTIADVNQLPDDLGYEPY